MEPEVGQIAVSGNGFDCETGAERSVAMMGPAIGGRPRYRDWLADTLGRALLP
jgi:hypothetical protein